MITPPIEDKLSSTSTLWMAAFVRTWVGDVSYTIMAYDTFQVRSRYLSDGFHAGRVLAPPAGRHQAAAHPAEHPDAVLYSGVEHPEHRPWVIKTSPFRAYHFKASTASSLVDVAIRSNSLKK